jgi:plastocyanin
MKFFAIRTRTSRTQRGLAVGVLMAAIVGTAIWALPATAKSSKPSSAKVTTVLVTLGKPSEFAITLNKFSNLPAGKIIFKVTNKGVIAHDFKVCTKAFTAKTLANACVGPKTKSLNKGQTATLTVTLKKGKFEFLCSLSGHAKNGMKGLMGVGTVISKKEAGGTVGATTAGPGAGPGGGGGACASPTPTTLNVGMGEMYFTGVPSTLKCGPVQINATNEGAEDHNITFAGSPPGTIVPGGGHASQSITLNPGVYAYVCDVGIHAAQGMAGSVTVTQ